MACIPALPLSRIKVLLRSSVHRLCNSCKSAGEGLESGYSSRSWHIRHWVLKDLVPKHNPNIQRCFLQQNGGQQQRAFACIAVSRNEEVTLDRLLGGETNVTALATLLRSCSTAKTLFDGRRVHSHITTCGYDGIRFLANCLVQMYGSCGNMEDARAVFRKISCPNMYSWTILLTVSGQNGSLDDAKLAFGRMPDRSVVAWNAMMTAFLENGHGNDTLNLLCMMQFEGVQPDNITFVCALDACATVKAGKRIHLSIAEIGYLQDLLVGTALVSMYGRCGCVHNARNVFDRMLHRDIVCWNAMIAAFAQNDHGKEAINLFYQMLFQGVTPDNVSFLCALDACASLSAVDEGQYIHAAIVDNGCEQDVVVGTALVNLYGKCGNFQDAKNIFVRMPYRNVVSWNAIIGILAQNGYEKESLNLFHQMQLEGIKPNSTTFISVLTACSHTGLVDMGRHLFFSMDSDHGIKPTSGHYGCMIDLLGRAGHLDEAEDLLNIMPFEKDYVTWRCMLGACKLHGDVERGIRAASRCFVLDQENASPYVTLSNIYAVTSKPERA